MLWKYAGRYVLPFSPATMKMELKWSTALADTISGTYTRSMSHDSPQITLSYTARLKGVGLQFATDRVLRDIGQEVLVPLWQDVATEKVNDTTARMSSTIMTFYRVGGSVLLWASDTQWQISTVSNVTATTIVFGSNTTPWKCIMPIEEGFVLENPSTSTDRNGNTTLNYSVTLKALGYIMSGLGEDPMLTNTPIMGSKSQSYNLHLNVVSSVGGNVRVNSMRSVPTVSATHSWDIQSRSDYFEMLYFLGRCRGRKNQFLAASFTCDLNLTANANVGQGFIDIADPGLSVLSMVGLKFTVVRGKSWSPSEVYEVVSLSTIAGGIRLTLDSALSNTIFIGDLVSNLRYTRLNSDSVTIEVDGPSRFRASVSIRDNEAGG